MRNLDYICESSAHPEPIILRDVQGASGSPPPPCPTCGAPTEILWALSYAHNPSQFRACTIYADLGDGRGKRRLDVTTLHQLRAVERRTRNLWEQGLADPVVVVQYSQDRSNHDVDVFEQYDDTPRPGSRSGRGPGGSRFQVGHLGGRDTPREVLEAYESGRAPVFHVDLGEI